MFDGAGSLRRRVALWTMAFGAVAAIAIGVLGSVFNERAEGEIWRALHALDPALVVSGAHDARYGGPNRIQIFTYVRDARGNFDAVPPGAIDALEPGLHDDIVVGGHTYVVSVSDQGSARHFVVLDITALEDEEYWFSVLTAATMLAVLLAIAFAGLRLGRWFIEPVTDLEQRIAALDPSRRGTRLGMDYDATEIAAIAAAMDRYLTRLDGFVQRERDFILSAEHELRTPMAVVAGALDLLETGPDDPQRRTAALHRIRRGTEDMNETLTALLFLAAEPGNDEVQGERCQLDALLPELIGDHEYLLGGRQVVIRLGRVTPTRLAAPSRIVYIAIGNLLRNAIANTSAGQIEITLNDGVFVIVDSGRGMSPEAISEAYRAEIRNEQQTPRRGGLGLFLIRRICTRFDWTLEIASPDGAGTRIELDLRSRLI